MIRIILLPRVLRCFQVADTARVTGFFFRRDIGGDCYGSHDADECDDDKKLHEGKTASSRPEPSRRTSAKV